MKSKIKQRFAASLLAVMMILTYPIQASAQEGDGLGSFFRGLFASENSSAFNTLEIRKGTLNGELVVNLLSPAAGWKLETNQDYYIYGEVKKPAAADLLQIRAGNADGTFNGLTFFNPPGGTYTPGAVTHDYFDRLASYDVIPDPTYGSGNTKLALQDGAMTYQIKSQVSSNEIITFAMGLVVNDAAFSGATTLAEALQVSIGHLDAGSFVADSSKTSDINMSPKGSLRAFYSSTAATATLDSPGATLVSYIGDTSVNAPVAMLYDTLEWDIYLPQNAILANIGFSNDGLFSKTHSNYGMLSTSAPVMENGQQKIHLTLFNGYKVKGSNLIVYFNVKFPSAFFSAGEQHRINYANTTITPKGTTTPVRITDVSSPAVYTILDTSTDYSTITAMNRPEVYNHTIDGDDPYFVTLGSANIVNKSTSNPSPYAKTYEASFNTTNTAAAIAAITVPLGTATDPVVIWYGKDASGAEKSGTLANPADYAVTQGNIAGSKNLRLRASDFGIETFTAIKAEIGNLRAGYGSSGSTSSWDINYNGSGAFGHFTTAESGIQVKNTYRLYNTDPAYRNQAGGNLSVTSVATSSASERMGFSSDSVTIKNAKGAVVDSIAAGETATIAGYLYPYSAPTNAKKGVYAATDAVAVNPVFYLTLPRGMTYEALTFKINEVEFNKTATNTPAVISHSVENVSYLNRTGDGTSIYRITFPKGTAVGYYAGNGSRILLHYTVTLRTSKSMETKRYELNSLMGISTENQAQAMPYSANPAAINTLMPDVYGINGGKDYAGITKGSATAQPGFGLQQLAEINVYNAISVTRVNGQPVNAPWQTYDASDPNSIASLGKNSEGQFKLNIQNTSDNASKELKIFIPIPKTGLDLGAAFMDQAAQFDMSMEIPTAELTAADFTGSYVKISGSYADCAETINYVASDAANANAILLTTASVSARADHEFFFPFQVTGKTAGNINVWRNVFEYTTSDSATNYKNGSYVASAVAGSSITGVVFEDRNRNGLREAGEPGVSGITVVVKDDQNKILSAVTDASGSYTFLAVRDTALDMQFTAPESGKLRFNLPASESPAGSAVTPAANGLSAAKALTANNAVVTVNAALSGYHVLQYNKNNAAASGDLPVDSEFVMGSLATVSVKPDNLLLKGFEFEGWNTAVDGSGASYQAGQTLTIQGDTTLYAVWKIGTYMIRFDYRGATDNNSVIEKQLVHNQPYNTGGNLPAPTRTGYSFAGWCTTSTGTAAISNATKFTLGEDTTLYALWKAKTGYQVSYDTGVGGSAIANVAVAWTDSVLPKEQPTRAGYRFDGWEYAGAEISTTTAFGELSGSEAEKTLTLTARWTAKGGYAVNYDTDGAGTIAPMTDVLWSDDGLLPETAPTKSGSAFGGWILDGAGTEVTNASSYGALAGNEATLSITIKAVWNVIANNTVQYATGGGTVYPDKTNVQSGDSGLIPAIAPVRLGYEFVAWMVGGTTVTKDTVYSDLNSAPNSLVTLTANWKAKSYTVAYAQGGFASETKNWNDSGLVAGKTPTKPGSVFDAWYYHGVKVTDVTKISQLIPLDQTSAITLEARFSEDSYTVVYNSFGGEAFAPKTAVKYSAVGLLPDKSPVRTGYTFAGWYCGGIQVMATTTCGSLVNQAVGQTITLGARWTEKTGYTVNYNSAGGTAVQSKTGVSWGAAELIPDPAPTRTGYAFKGWISGRSVVSRTTTYGSLSGSDTAGSSVTLVAQWDVAGGYTVSFDTGMGSAVADRTGVSWNTQNLIPLQNVAPAGYVVKHWLCGGVVVTPSMTYGELDALSGGGPVTLTAVYEPITGDSGNGMDVQGKVIEGGESAVYKIDLIWGPMKFEYSAANIWDPDTHSYEQRLQGWANEPFNGINNKVSAINHSNADVEVDFRAVVEDPDAMEGVTMEIRQQNRIDGDLAQNMLLGRVPTENAQAPEISSYLWMTGTPQNSSILGKDEYSKFGIINITIRATQSALTPKAATP